MWQVRHLWHYSIHGTGNNAVLLHVYEIHSKSQKYGHLSLIKMRLIVDTRPTANQLMFGLVV